VQSNDLITFVQNPFKKLFNGSAASREILDFVGPEYRAGLTKWTLFSVNVTHGAQV